jgi:hypothetical protein
VDENPPGFFVFYDLIVFIKKSYKTGGLMQAV